MVGRDFNRARFDPVANSKFMDDRPWAAVDAFARNLVIGEACLSSLVAPVDRVDADAGGEPEDDGATRERLDPAAPCDGEGIDPSGARLRDARADRARRAPRHAYRFSVRYYGPGFAGWAWRAEDAKYFDDAPWSVRQSSPAAAFSAGSGLPGSDFQISLTSSEFSLTKVSPHRVADGVPSLSVC